MAYLDWLDLDELQRQKQVESQAYSDAIAVQNHSASNNETPKEPPELAAQTQAMTKDSDNPYNPTVAESPESPVPIRELIATSPHVLSDGENAASSQGAPAPQRSLSDDFVAAVDDASSDGEPDPSPDGDGTSNGSVAPIRTHTLYEETEEDEVASSPPTLLQRILTLSALATRATTQRLIPTAGLKEARSTMTMMKSTGSNRIPAPMTKQTLRPTSFSIPH
ncbi:uncharacterized protein IUM83_04879 [Phytophthora cinnamomi]|uniref:uncharacterized protein n=1 Tax=Phytophthora cinnamomi TaxID=4785 RepID=UPI00355A775E|nr:hypothetical protein IUM83_04879 [Phytophthora cinnamomi]